MSQHPMYGQVNIRLRLERTVPSIARMLVFSPRHMHQRFNGLYSHITLLDADTVLCIFGCANMQPVPSPVNGRVKYISNDTGEYFAVSIAADDDMEVVYTGLASSGVEIGQSVLEGDTLGLCGGHALTVQVYINGVPQEPAQLFGIEGSM